MEGELGGARGLVRELRAEAAAGRAEGAALEGRLSAAGRELRGQERERAGLRLQAAEAEVGARCRRRGGARR